MDDRQQIIDRAQKQDLARQQQINNQKAALDRMLDRESAVRSICNQAVVEGNNSSYIDRILGVLNG